MNLSELLIIFVNKVLITQTKDLLSFMSRMNSLIRGKINKPGDSKVWRFSVLHKHFDSENEVLFQSNLLCDKFSS